MSLKKFHFSLKFMWSLTHNFTTIVQKCVAVVDLFFRILPNILFLLAG